MYVCKPQAVCALPDSITRNLCRAYILQILSIVKPRFVCVFDDTIANSWRAIVHPNQIFVIIIGAASAIRVIVYPPQTIISDNAMIQCGRAVVDLNVTPVVHIW